MANEVTPSRALMVMDSKDNVAVCLRPMQPGEEVQLARDEKVVAIKMLEAVPVGHKVALSAVSAGQPIVKYGEVIGRATRNILAGQHVHDRNISDY